MRKITNEEYNVLINILLDEYCKFVKFGNWAKCRDENDLRFGQKIINLFYMKYDFRITNSKIFNEENLLEAFVAIGSLLNESREDYTPDV